MGLDGRKQYHTHGHHLYLYAHADGKSLLLDTRRRSQTDDLSWDGLAWARGWLARSEDYDRQINANLIRTLEALVGLAWIDVVCVDLACVVCMALTKVKTRRSLLCTTTPVPWIHTVYTSKQSIGSLSESWETGWKT